MARKEEALQMRIGASINSAHTHDFNGTIDDVAVYENALNDSDVLQLFNNQSVRFASFGDQIFRPFNTSFNTNSINVTETFQNLFNSNISARIGQINSSVNISQLLAYYPTDFGKGWDATTNGHDVIQEIGNPQFNKTSGVNGTGGTEYDGSDGLELGPNEKAFNFVRTNNFSMSAWVLVNSDTNTQRTFLSKLEASPGFQGYEWRLHNNDRWRFFMIGTSSGNIINVQSSPAFDYGNYHHYVVTYNGSSAASGVEMYVDGLRIDTTTITD
ncbi:hypothetical protein LCGC14_3082990, partial [marine sediment metagenome]